MKSKTVILAITIPFFSLTIPFSAAAGSWAPAAGVAGSTAISMNDPAFVAWGTGYSNYILGANVDAQWQTPEKALGKAVGDSYDIVCLGNGGQITLTFANPISNGPGADFAIFENSFSDTFLELAFVEVSTDGNSWKRFYNSSLTQNPVGAFGSVDPTNVWQLGSKYRQGWGEPYDLDYVGLTAISYVRLIDIIGDGNTYDSFGSKIYDPTPTVGSGGFDLEAIGVIHQSAAPVPVPGALWLLGSGLVSLGCMKRRKTKE